MAKEKTNKIAITVYIIALIGILLFYQILIRPVKKSEVAVQDSTAQLIAMQDTIYFDFASSEVKEENLETISNIASNSRSKVFVVGFADTVGSKANNYKLSLDRANAIKLMLCAHGLSYDSVFVSYAGENAIEKLKEKENLELNRRVVISWKKHQSQEKRFSEAETTGLMF